MFDDIDGPEDITAPEAEVSYSSEAATAWQNGWAAGYWAACQEVRAAHAATSTSN